MLKSEVLSILSQKISDCTLCEELTDDRKAWGYHTVPGEGAPNARLMIIGESPGKDEAEQGKPFVGPSGRLLNKIIQAAGWKREDIFIANILKCRPPNNRDPLPLEAANCRRFLDIQIRCVDPEAILCLGRIACLYLLGRSPESRMASLRGIHDYQGRMVVCSFHPSYLLRNPPAKADLWEDIQPLIEKLAAK